MFSGVRAALVALCDPQLALILALLITLLMLAAQAPLRYTIAVGQEDGPGSDLPLLDGVYPPERDVHGAFRWTRDRTTVRLPGVGQRPLLVAIKVFPVNQEVAERGPKQLELWTEGRLLQALPVQPRGAVYHVMLPPPRNGAGDQTFEIRSATFVPTGDERSIGTPIDTITVTSAPGIAFPAWRSGALWLLAAFALWIALRSIGFASRSALLLMLPPVALVGLAASLDPPRAALGAQPALVALSLGLALVLALRTIIPRLARLFDLPLDARALRWLLLLALLAFGLRYGGKLYPNAMPGDIGFHVNRFADVIRGQLELLSRHRGVSFPYPSAFYLTLAPLTLFGIDRGTALRLVGAVFDAISPVLVYTIASVALMGNRIRATRPSPFALVAASIYALSASGFMATWWNFSTHIFAQFTHLLLITSVVLFWRASSTNAISSARFTRLAIIGLCFIQILVYLGHFGFWMNMTILGGIGLSVLFAAVQRTWAEARQLRVLLLSFAIAQAVSITLLYSGYAVLFVEQARLAASGGLTGLAGREAVPFDILWETLWDAGLRVHFGFFPVPLALGALALFWRPSPATDRAKTTASPAAALFVLLAGTFLIGCGFAVLPFFSGSSLATRWLMFSAWAIAVGAALTAREFWRRGRVARLIVVLTLGYTFWITAIQWIGALAWRIRPPEPF
jgi:hypothetical protein